jgi:signal transduction histidine kinase
MLTAVGTISNELYQTTDLALLCEDLVNGMIAAGEWAGSADTSIPISNDYSRRNLHRLSHHRSRDAVEIIMDIEHYEWEFKVQAGALRRVIMNIFGNAQKYTDSGYILIEVGIRKTFQDGPRRSATTPQEVLLIHIRDSGRGMSSEYLERKLYHPFAQEDSFAPGVGLGLSIV